MPESAQKQAEPQGLFPKSIAEAHQMIEERRARIADLEQQRGALEAQASQLRQEVDVLNALRTVQGAGPV
jgi:hypothetical protein